MVKKSWRKRDPTWRKRDRTWRKSNKVCEKVNFVGEKNIYRNHYPGPRLAKSDPVTEHITVLIASDTRDSLGVPYLTMAGRGMLHNTCKSSEHYEFCACRNKCRAKGSFRLSKSWSGMCMQEYAGPRNG